MYEVIKIGNICNTDANFIMQSLLSFKIIFVFFPNKDILSTHFREEKRGHKTQQT